MEAISSLSRNELKVLVALEQGGTINDVMARTGINRVYAYECIKKLNALGLVDKRDYPTTFRAKVRVEVHPNPA